MFRDHLYLICGRATLSCVKIPFDPCPRLHPPCVSRWTLCRHCVCVGPCLVPPPPTASNRWSLPINLISGAVTLTCVKIVSDTCSRLYRSSVSRGHCVCVCLTVPALSAPHYASQSSEPINLISGRATLHVSRLVPILARDSIHPVYHEGHCVCVCVCVFDIACSLHPPLRPPDVHSPLIGLVCWPR